MNSRRLGAAVGALALTLVVGACGDDTDKGGGDSRTTQDSLTSPGTTLDFGQTATVESEDGAAKIDVTVTGISRAPASDLAKIKYDNAASEDVYYVKYAFKLLQGDPDFKDMRDYLSVYTSDSNADLASALHIFEPFPPCREQNFPQPAEDGTSVSSCGAYVVKKGAPAPERVVFHDAGRYDIVNDDGIEWE